MLYFVARRSKQQPSGNDVLENQVLLNGMRHTKHVETFISMA